MKIPIKVISLKHSINRRKYFSQTNDSIKYEFIDAIDGNQIPRNQLSNPELFIQPLPFPSKGAYGCALSHMTLWDLAIEKNSPLTIAEDDAVFRKDFHYQSEKFISSLPEDWDFILWGWNFKGSFVVKNFAGTATAAMSFNEDELRRNIGNFSDKNTRPIALELVRAMGHPAYTISPRGAKKFKSNCFPMRNFHLILPHNKKIQNVGIDIATNRIYPSTNSFVSFPPLVVTENHANLSTIQIN